MMGAYGMCDDCVHRNKVNEWAEISQGIYDWRLKSVCEKHHFETLGSERSECEDYLRISEASETHYYDVVVRFMKTYEQIEAHDMKEAIDIAMNGAEFDAPFDVDGYEAVYVREYGED